MNELYEKLKKYSIDDSIKIEESDRQYIALKSLWDKFSLFSNQNVSIKSYYLSLILANSIICYQLSGKWEDYWEEFSTYFRNKWIVNSEKWIVENLSNFIKQSKNNKRFVDTKISRLEKLKNLLGEFSKDVEFYYDNMEILRDKLAKTMNQKPDAKTIVFAIKMFSYGARNVFDKLVYFPESISIPIDSRLTNLYEKYKWDNISNNEKNNIIEIKEFYFDLSKKLGIPELHLDALVWVNYNELID